MNIKNNNIVIGRFRFTENRNRELAAKVKGLFDTETSVDKNDYRINHRYHIESIEISVHLPVYACKKRWR